MGAAAFPAGIFAVILTGDWGRYPYMIIKSFLPRAVCLFLILQGPIWAIADFLAPFTGGFAYESAARKVASDFASEPQKTSKRCADIAQCYNAAWIHVTDKNKHVTVSTRPGGIPAESGQEGEASRVMELKGSRFVEVSQPLASGESLSVGFRCPGLLSSLISKQIFPGQLPVGTIMTVLALNVVSLLAAYLAFLGIPLWKTLSRLDSGEDPPETFPAHVSSELEAISRGIKKRFADLKGEHEKNMSAARADLSGAFAKEVEERFANRLTREAVDLESSGAVCRLTINSLAEEFHGVVRAGFGVEFDARGRFRLIDSQGFSEEQVKYLGQLGSSRFAILVKKITSAGFLRPDELAEKRLEQICSELGCDQFLVLPIESGGTVRAHVCFFVTGKDQPAMQKLDRTLKKMSEQFAPLWHLISKYEEAFKLSRFDYLTGIRNRLYLEQNLPSFATPPADAEGETVFLIFEGDNFRHILGSYGPRTIDKLIRELAEELLSAFDKSVRYKKASARIKFHDFVYRLGGCRFLLVLEDSSLKKAVEMAESVIQTVSERTDWAHGMPSWSVSCGIASISQSTPADSLEIAMITLDYIRSRKQIGAVMLSKDVPPEYMSRVLSMNSAGSLSVSDPAAILQTLMQSQKSGILTVSAPNGRVFWSFLENGKPTKARLGKLSGDAAVVEFICEFADCTHRVQDLSTLNAQASEEMKTLGGAYVLSMPLSELIDFAVKSKEAAELGRQHLKNLDMIVHPTVDKQAGQVANAFYKAGKSVNKLYLETAGTLWDLCSGRFSFDEITVKLQDELPMALVWSAADFFLQNKLIKFSRLRVSTLSESPSSEQAARAGFQPAAAAPKPAGVRHCVACHRVDPLSQKFCVHCGAEMVE
jgi:diguanylate cyclase (GGDEF)-like protein